jgi:drug/metabolite transporter (DMT)-like permease
MQTAPSRPFYRSRWWMPGFCLFLGLLILGAFWLGDNPGTGFASLGIMLALGAVFFFGGRSETLRGLGGPGRDERWAKIDIHATALAGMVLISVIIGAFLVEVARGHDGNPYGLLGAVAGVAYLIAVIILRARS